MVLVETRSAWIDDNGYAQPGKLSPNQAREIAAGNVLLGKTQRGADQNIGIPWRSLLNQPLRHRTWSQIRTCEGDEVPAFAEALQHVLLLFFWVAQIVEADNCAFVEIDTCVGGRKLHRTDAGMDLNFKAREGTDQPLEAGRASSLRVRFASRTAARVACT